MELAIIGLVTSEGALQLWTREGSCAVKVADPSRLLGLLGAGRADREAMLPGWVIAEMVLLDLPAGTFTVSAPFQPEDGQIFPIGPPFRFRPVSDEDRAWVGAGVEDLPERLAALIARAGQRGEVLTIQERDADGQGHRRLRCYFEHDGDEWCSVVETNDAPAEDDTWSKGWKERGTTVLRFSDDADSPQHLALLALTAVVRWSESPLDLVLGWSASPDGPRPRPNEANPTPATAGMEGTGKDRGGHLINAVHIPSSPDAPMRVVTIDRRNVVAWYPLVSGGPVEAAPVRWKGIPPDELYVNSRYPELDPSAINERATDLLEQLGVPMALDHLRGDALLVSAPDGRDYPGSVAEEVVRIFCG